MGCGCNKKRIKNELEKTYSLPKNIEECPCCGSISMPDDLETVKICKSCFIRLKEIRKANKLRRKDRIKL